MIDYDQVCEFLTMIIITEMLMIVILALVTIYQPLLNSESAAEAIRNCTAKGVCELV